MNDSIKLTNPGPVEGTFTIDLSPGYGAYELRGRRGSGKSTCLSSIDNWMTGHRVDVTLHDGALSGRVEGFGVVAPIGSRKRRKGELPLDTIDAERFSLADLIDPPGKTPDVRDAHRIKALAALSDAKADAALYYDLAGGQTEFDGLGIDVTEDPVLLATRIKRAFDSTARANQNTADAEAGHAAPLEHVPEGLDMTGQDDAEVLQGTLEAAIRDLARIEQVATDYEQRYKTVTTARSHLEAEEANYTGPSVSVATVALRHSREYYEACQLRETQAEEVYEKAKAETQAANILYLKATGEVESSESHDRALGGWNETIDAFAELVEPSDGERSDAEACLFGARECAEQGVRIRDVNQNHKKATAHRVAEKMAEKAADEARNKAAQVFDILAESLHTKHLEIHTVDGNPRLFVQHKGRGKTAFDAVNGLSDGERVDWTLRELLPHIDSPGMLPIPQRVWQDLQPSDRKRFHLLAVDNGHFIFGAQVDDGELRVVYLGDEQENDQ